MERKIRTTLALSYLLLLAGCTYNPFRTDNDLTGNPIGPAIGGIVGAGSMAMLHAPKGLIILGGVGGAAIGYYATTLTFAAGGVTSAGGQVYALGDFVTIEIPTDKLFDVNSSDLLPEAKPILDSAVMVLNRFPDDNIMVSGNTSGFGPNHYEEKISEDRARHIAGYLWANGVNAFNHQSIKLGRKLTYVGYGNYFPIANNIHNASIRSNSRIQITGYPSKSSLHLDKKHKLLNNIGDTSVEETKQKTVIDFSREFPNEGLPEHASSRTNDFKDAINEEPMPQNRISPGPPPRPNYYHESESFKGETWGNYKSPSTADQTNEGGNVSKQAGFSLKDELR